ncbi:MAG TPA: precorrin-6y C5,15-methyltransferase (decarboxylating) subunit CbiE [Thermoguttaceae bacterium]
MAFEDKIYIIGVGENGLEGLTAAPRKLIEKADLLIGDEHTLATLPAGTAERLVVRTDLDESVRRIQSGQKKHIVVLASGDPLFYGVARYLCDKLGKDRFEVIPHVSSMQLAFARVKESWEEAFLTNLANHTLPSVLEQIRGAEKAGLFTTDSCPPAKVAQALLDAGIDYFTAYVCENLGSPDERVTHGELAEIAAHDFSPLNVMILIRKPNVPDRPREAIGRRLFGNPDDAFIQSKPKRGLLTPAEIRAMALAEMDLGPSSIVWDVGAGSGSVAIEAAQLAPHGTVFAIEMDQEDYQLIIENAKQFGVRNLTPVLGRAPEAWKDLPQPDGIFFGGSGQGISRLVDAAYSRLRVGGRLVATISSIDNLAETHRALHNHTPDVKVWMLNFARGNYQLERIRFESLNPSFLVSVVKAK